MTRSKDKDLQPLTAPISFPRWGEVLRSEQQRQALARSHEVEIFSYLKYFKAARQPASVESVLAFRSE